jgi:ABC-2 type transport system permease protein
MENPDSSLTVFFLYFPFTAPVVALVKLAVGFSDNNTYQLFLSLFVTLLSSIAVLSLAARLFKNGLLQFGHSLKLRNLINWLKK